MRNAARRLDNDQFEPWFFPEKAKSNGFKPKTPANPNDEYLRWIENADALAARAASKRNPNEA